MVIVWWFIFKVCGNDWVNLFQIYMSFAASVGAPKAWTNLITSISSGYLSKGAVRQDTVRLLISIWTLRHNKPFFLSEL